jgi:hypothetical protein
LRQPQPGQPGLDFCTVGRGLLVLALGEVQTPAEPGQLGDAVVRPAGQGSGQPRAGPLGLFGGVRPVPAHLHDLGPVHHAPAPERDEAGLLVDPCAERLRPFLSAAQVEALHAQPDRRAVRHARHLRHRAAGGDVQQRLVDGRRRLARPVEHGQAGTPADAAEDEQVDLTPGAGDLGHPLEHRQRGRRLTGPHGADRVRRQPPGFEPTVRIVAHQAADARVPTSGLGHLAAILKVKTQPAGAEHRLLDPALVEVELVRALTQSDDLVVVTEQEGGHRQLLELLRW